MPRRPRELVREIAIALHLALSPDRSARPHRARRDGSVRTQPRDGDGHGIHEIARRAWSRLRWLNLPSVVR
jgi:hypothetical protein